MQAKEGGWYGKRKIRNVEEDFHIVLCSIAAPATAPNPPENIFFDIPYSSSQESYSLAIN